MKERIRKIKRLKKTKLEGIKEMDTQPYLQPRKRRQRKKYSLGTQSIKPPAQGKYQPDTTETEEYLQTISNRQGIATSAMSSGLDQLAPGLGKAMSGMDSLSTSLTRNEEGEYKSGFARIADNTLNPYARIKALSSGNAADIGDAATFGLASTLGLNKKLGLKTSSEIAKDKREKAKKAADLMNMADQYDEDSKTVYQRGQYFKKGTKSVKTAAWTRKEGKSPTGGLNQKGIASYRRENPGSKLSMAVTEDNPTGKRANRRKSFCARMSGMRGDLYKMVDKDRDGDKEKVPTRKLLSLQKWKCKEYEKGTSSVNAAGNYTRPEMRKRLFNQIKNSNIQGTKSGMWSARKAQLLAKKYKENGGKYLD